MMMKNSNYIIVYYITDTAFGAYFHSIYSIELSSETFNLIFITSILLLIKLLAIKQLPLRKSRNKEKMRVAQSLLDK